MAVGVQVSKRLFYLSIRKGIDLARFEMRTIITARPVELWNEVLASAKSQIANHVLPCRANFSGKGKKRKPSCIGSINVELLKIIAAAALEWNRQSKNLVCLYLAVCDHIDENNQQRPAACARLPCFQTRFFYVEPKSPPSFAAGTC